MAEREGFEPSVELPLHSISNAAPSSTRPSLRIEIGKLNVTQKIIFASSIK